MLAIRSCSLPCGDCDNLKCDADAVGEIMDTGSLYCCGVASLQLDREGFTLLEKVL